MALKLECRAIGIWLLLACSVGLFVLCFTYIDVRAFYSNSKELQGILQSVGNLGTSSLNSHDEAWPGSPSEAVQAEDDSSGSVKKNPVKEFEATAGNRSNSAEFGLHNGTLESQTGKADSQSKVLPVETMSKAPASNKSLSGCEISQGRWVYDETYPLYRSKNCPFLDPGFRCVENGRLDTDFMKYRWQPHDCDLPRFDAKGMLERLRDQRLVFVGDSLGRNHWESMMCMLAEGVQNKSRIYETNGEPITKHTGHLVFRFQDYNCTVEYYREPFLVPQTRPPPGSPSNVTNVLQIDQVARSVKNWRGANILVFNTGHWWLWERTLGGGGRFQMGNNLTTHSLEDAFQIAMKTWALWMEDNLDPATTQVIFRSYASRHYRYHYFDRKCGEERKWHTCRILKVCHGGGSWNTEGRCDEEVKLLTDLEGQEMIEAPWTNKHIVDAINQNVKTKRGAVEFMDITMSTNYRADGHPGVYSDLPADKGQDCSHFCLPGVPDTWNEVLYATLLARGQGIWGESISY